MWAGPAAALLLFLSGAASAAVSDLDRAFSLSGVEALIDAIAQAPQTLIDASSEASQSEEAYTVTQRLIEILSSDWDAQRIREHYVQTFDAAPQPQHLKEVLRLLDLAIVRKLHLDQTALEDFDRGALTRFAKGVKRGAPDVETRLRLIGRIDAARGITEGTSVAYGASTGTMMRVINEIKPKGSRMSTETLEREHERVMYDFRRRLDRRNRLLLLHHYKDVSTQELEEYVELIEAPAFRWFSRNVFSAYASMAQMRFAAAEDEVLELFKEVRREALGVSEGPSIEGMAPELAVST